MWAINLSESQRINPNLRFRKSLFTRLGLLVIVFTISLTAVLYYQFDRSYITQNSILDAHENYYYSQMVSRWGNPPDTNHVLHEINNLQMWCGIFELNTTTSSPNLVNRLFRNGRFSLILGLSDKFITYTMNCLNKSGIIGSFT